MKKAKTWITIVVVLVVVTASGFVGIKFLNYMRGPRINVDSPVISKVVDETGKPFDIIAEKSEIAEKGIPVISKSQKFFVVSAKKNTLIELDYSYIRLYYLCEYDEEPCKSGEDDCKFDDQDFFYIGKKLSEVKCSLTESKYYNLTIENLDELKDGRYRVSFLDDDKVRNTSIDFILKSN